MVALCSPSTSKSSELALAVQCRFLESGHQPLRHLRVEERHGRVIVSGHVPSFYLKQLAQTIASTVDGVDRVQNETVVSQSELDTVFA